MSLQGAIEELGLCELIQALALNRYRGTLRIEPDGAPSQFFYLDEGEIVLLRTVDSEPVRIVDGKAVDKALHLRFEEEFLDIFLLDRGRFEFIFGLTPEALFPADQLERIKLNTSSLMLEAMRRVDEWHALLSELGSLDEIYQKRVPRARLDEADLSGSRLTATQRAATLDSLDGDRSLRELLAIVQEAGGSRLAALHFMEKLKKRDLVAALGEEAYISRLAQALASKDVDGTAKLIRCLLAKGPLDVSLVEQYIDFLRSSGRPSFARQECKLLGAHYLGRGEVDHAIGLYERALELDPRDTEVLDRLFYAHLRKSDIERALALAGPLRDAVARERDLGTVSRIVKNMKELSPQDVRVLELSGLVAKRQERLDEARTDLTAALEAAQKSGADEAKKNAILQALSEVDPSRKPSGVATNYRSSDAAIPIPRPTGIAPRPEKRRPWLAALGLLLIVPFVLEEARGRSELARARDAEAASAPADRLAALGLYESASGRISSVRATARARADALREQLDATLRGPPRPVEPLAVTSAAPPSKPPAVTDSDFADYDSARLRSGWPLAAKLARRLHDSKDLRAGYVRMPFRVTTNPEGARVTFEGGEGRTPCILEAPVDRKVTLRIQKPGCAPKDVTHLADTFVELTIDLERGPTWRRALRGPIASVGAAPGLALAVTRPATLNALSLEDGEVAWQKNVDGEESLGAPGYSQGLILVSARSGTLLTFATSGTEKARTRTKRALFAPQGVEVDNADRTLLATADALVVVDAVAGQVLREIPLLAAPVAPPAVKANRAWALLADGTVAAADLAKGVLLWTAEPRVQVAGGPVLIGSTVYLASRDGSLVAISLSNGATSWRRPAKPPGATEHGATADEGRVVIASSSRLVAFDAKDGKQLWEEPLAACGPAVRIGGKLYAPVATGEVLEIESATGKTLSRYAFDGPFAGFATVGRVLVVASGGGLEAIDRGE